MKRFYIYILFFLPVTIMRPQAFLINMIPQEQNPALFYHDHKNIFAGLENSINSLQTGYISQGVIKSSATAFYANGAMIYSDFHGLKSDTVMPIASLTKPFTSYAIMKLAEEGLLDIYSPVTDYLDIPKQDYGKVRVIDLLMQVSGIPYASSRYIDLKMHNKNYSVPVPLYPVGEKFIYSNANYRILSMVIESVTGKKFQDYMRTVIFPSFAMTGSMFGDNPNAGASGMASSMDDIARFAREMVSRKEEGFRFQSGENMISLLNPPPGMKTEKNMEYYGLGWRVKLLDNKLYSFYHTGVWYGSLAVLVIYPQKNAFFIHFATPPDIRENSLNDYRWKLDSLADRFMAQLPDDI